MKDRFVCAEQEHPPFFVFADTGNPDLTGLSSAVLTCSAHIYKGLEVYNLMLKGGRTA